MRKKLIILSGLLILSSFMIIFIFGREATIEYDIQSMENLSVTYDKNVIDCVQNKEDGKLKLVITPVNKGKTDIVIDGNVKQEDSTIENKQYKKSIYVHSTGIITKGDFFGNCNGDISIIISILIILLMWLWYAIRQFRRGIKKNLYGYRNVRLLGLIIFISLIFLWNLYIFIIDLLNNYNSSLYYIIVGIRDSSALFSMLMLPVAIITSVLVTISNIVLIRNEGRTWRNMLGVILGGFLCIGTISFIIFESTSVSTNNMNSIVINIICYILSIGIAYLECILFGTIVLGIVSARHIPKFDKDYILILGCKIKEDGTLTPLLKSRVDKAIEFAKMQKEATGKDIIFVPSGGKGEDEIISEAEAMKKYLIEQKIDKNEIMVENKSTNTYENFKFSNNLIKEKNKNSNIAFSTTNYHVFRAGIIASSQNLYAEGIGSKTKVYYWVNAFIREFVATLVSEKGKHIRTMIILMTAFLILTIMYYISMFA